MPSLADVQREFARSLVDSDLPAPRPVRQDAPGTSSRRFDVYRNNRAVSLVEALQSAFPALRRLVGEAYFQAAARAYIDAHPPRSPVLLQYGEHFGGFLESLPSAGRAPYLGDVARLEWLRLRALHAADAEPAGIGRLGAVPEALIDEVTLTLHPSASVLASRWPVVSLWSATVNPRADDDKVDMTQPEQALVVRPGLRIAVHELPAGGEVFVNALADNATLGEAALRGAEAADTFDLAAQLRGLFQAGAVTAVNLPKQ